MLIIDCKSNVSKNRFIKKFYRFKTFHKSEVTIPKFYEESTNDQTSESKIHKSNSGLFSRNLIFKNSLTKLQSNSPPKKISGTNDEER